jgi:antitoxin component of RelBE/YafQ-DinJ toxin-antitoxin module
VVKRGRPSKVNREEVKKSITVRIDDGEREKLDAYCKAKGITRAEAIRAWINAIC